MIGLSDVMRLEEDTRAMRELDYRRGGEHCVDGVRLRIHDSGRLLATPAAEQVRRRLHVALADLRNLAGWVCFDAGQVTNAHNHFSYALALAGIARDDGLIANVCYRLGRVFLHHGHLDDALRYFELGQLAASRSGDELGASILSVNSAWACAKKGSEHVARTLLDRGQEQFTAADRTDVAEWAKFFTEADLSALAGAVHTDLACTVGPRHARTCRSAAHRGDRRIRRGHGPQPDAQPDPVVHQPPDRRRRRSRCRGRTAGAGVSGCHRLGSRARSLPPARRACAQAGRLGPRGKSRRGHRGVVAGGPVSDTAWTWPLPP